jgi:inosine-uridine nucleoside N-ribohydrolase
MWVDTDAACGHGTRTDPDDCLAMLVLSQHQSADIVGVSTVFGNASLDETDRTTRSLMSLLTQDAASPPPVFRGSSAPLDNQPAGQTAGQDAHEALRRALEQQPLTILALGPLTNIAIALEGRPELQANVTRLVAVMGRRKGHVFHPIEGATAHSLLGHGPVFRDFNFIQDDRAAEIITAMGLPTTLIPYEAARAITLRPAVLDMMETNGGAAAWVAQRAQPWLNYWRDDIGIDGFYPFDLVAAAYAIDPTLFRCADLPIAVEADTWLFGWLGRRGLFVLPEARRHDIRQESGTALYCPRVSEGLESWLVSQLTARYTATPHVRLDHAD